MRAVATRIGVTPMALYSHVRDKQELLDAMLGRLLAELPLPRPRTSWRTQLRELAHGIRALAKRHPAVFPLILARPAVTPDALRVVDAIYGALRRAGIPDREVPRVERLISTAILGFAASEVGGRFGTGSMGTRARRAQAEPGLLPEHHALAEHLDRPVDWDAEFRADLAALTTLVEKLATSRR